MFSEVYQLLNPNARGFINLWAEAMKIAKPQRSVDSVYQEVINEALQVLIDCCQGKGGERWNLNQCRFWQTISTKDLDAVENLVCAFWELPTVATEALVAA